MSFQDKLETTYLQLPHIFYTKLEPMTYKHASLELLNTNVATLLGIQENELTTKEGVQWMLGSLKHKGAPFAQAYAGHQYGYFTKLGDGRAAIVGEIHHNNQRYDVHLKGSGRTPYSRNGDGYATLYSMLREYIISEAMFHLGVPTTRSLSVLSTGQTVHRDTPQKGAILTRVASSHIRFGTFEYARAFGTEQDLKQLADYAIHRHYPELDDSPSKYIDFFEAVVEKQAKLVAKWQSLGFVHGVLNTDNMLISGETIDYGPCAFLDQYRPSLSFSSIDRNGRYRFNNQPYIISWNLSKFAQALLPLIDSNQQQAIHLVNNQLQRFETIYTESFYHIMSKKVGIVTFKEEDKELIDEVLQLLEEYDIDYTNFFRLLTSGNPSTLNNPGFDRWYQQWRKRIILHQTEAEARGLMRENNPVLIPRNQLIEKALRAYAYNDDKTLFHTLYKAYQDPYNYNKIYEVSMLEPLFPNQSFTTYCGT
jgi:uncharacterized protein YdiU (UPF0061 family)